MIIFVLFVVVIIAFVAYIILSRVNWHDVLMRRWGNNSRHGEAVFVNNGVRSYEFSEAWHEGPFAMSYWRTTVINGQRVTYDDVVPNPPPGVPMQYDANGRRMYWPIAGGVICANKEDTSYQFTNYGPELHSSDMLDRTAMKYGTSVKAPAGGGGGWLLLIAAIAVVALLAFMFLRPGAAPAGSKPAAGSANTTSQAAPAGGGIYGTPATTPPGVE